MPDRTYWHSDQLDADDGAYDSENPETRKRCNEAQANLVASLTEDGFHAPVIDLDIPARLVPSSTEGHSHLYIDVDLTWYAYRRLLRALCEAGIIEQGYLNASEDRGMTMVRKPGVKRVTPRA